MSNDNKTLADVQPGGMVRLGGLLPEDVAQALAAVNEVANDARHAGNYRVANALVTARVTLSKQLLALSAQSSPGGQGVGVSISDDDRAVLQRLQDVLPTAGINGWAKGVEVLERLLRDSLAARQPVGKPIAFDYPMFNAVGIACVLEDRGVHFLSEAARYGFDEALDQMKAILESIGPLYTAPPAQAVDLGTGIKAIASERERQLCMEGFSRDSDQQYREGELARAATAYVQLAAMDLQVGSRKHIASQEPPFFWPWAPEWWKPVDARHDLVRAGALIAAQIDLIDSHAAGGQP
ncbi:TPA: hypothetical protein ACOEPG_000442 [Stenotrophomonas maltophilia]|uniref:hypothetical protein n=1 Tax=Stenotrophomonas maltophilia TaxID=40324 RepID=UPI000C148CE2|nr:hypothetical protein [Stenotrophomonas maltophilia]